jgi:hypothetical protein
MQPSLNGTCPTGFQFQTLQEKEVSILKNRECEDFYHRSSRIPSLVRIMTSQMVCASDTSREQFCYVSTSASCSLIPRARRWQGMGGKGEEVGRDKWGRVGTW